MTQWPMIRVSEVHGLRRFLYPLSVVLELPSQSKIDANAVALETSTGVRSRERTNPSMSVEESLATGVAVPTQLLFIAPRKIRLDFAVSLAPHETLDLRLISGVPAAIPDPLNIEGWVSRQERLTMEFGPDALVRSVHYDGIEHLRGPLRIERKGETVVSHTDLRQIPQSAAPERSEDSAHITPALTPITAGFGVTGYYTDGQTAVTTSEITACKSWIAVRNSSRPGVADNLVFTLPFAASGSNLLCDFGLGGGIYTRLVRSSGASVRLVINSEKGWSLSNGGRVDYMGQSADWDALRPQLWFHVVDDEKALAVAITQIPRTTSEVAIEIAASGDIAIGFIPDDSRNVAVDFEVYFHFLNAVPAIAAATCPQSILLRPVVEVL